MPILYNLCFPARGVSNSSGLNLLRCARYTPKHQKPRLHRLWSDLHVAKLRWSQIIRLAQFPSSFSTSKAQASGATNIILGRISRNLNVTNICRPKGTTALEP